MRYRAAKCVLAGIWAIVCTTSVNAAVIWTGGTFTGSASATAGASNDSYSFNSGPAVLSYSNNTSATATNGGIPPVSANSGANVNGSLVGDTFTVSGTASGSTSGSASANSGAGVSSYLFQLTDSRNISLTGALTGSGFGPGGNATLKFAGGANIYAVSGQMATINYVNVLAAGNYEFSISQSFGIFAGGGFPGSSNFNATLALTPVPEPSMLALLPAALMLTARYVDGVNNPQLPIRAAAGKNAQPI